MSGTVADAVHARQGRAERPRRRTTAGRRSQRRLLLAVPQAAVSTSASTAGGRIRATASTRRRGSRASACTGKARSIWRPNERPFALHRNGYAGMQRYGAFLWSGDVYSTWETLKTHVPVARQHGPVGHSVLGHRHRRLRADAGVHRRAARALVPVRRVLSARSARTAATGTCGCRGAGTPASSARWSCAATPAAPRTPTRASCTIAQVEPICQEVPRAALSAAAVHSTRPRASARDTGLPMMRALWLHHPDDASAVARGDQFLWGRDLLVAPVVEKGATIAPTLSAARHVVRLLDRGAGRGRPRDRATRRSRDDAALRARRDRASARSDQAIQSTSRSTRR